jgi:hypothetical protein
VCCDIGQKIAQISKQIDAVELKNTIKWFSAGCVHNAKLPYH